MCKDTAEYSIYINSGDAISGANVLDKTYGYDWNVIEDGIYDLTFSFKSSNINTPINDIALISLPDIGSIQQTQASSSTNSVSSNVIGVLNNFFTGGANVVNIQVSPKDNTPIRIRKPTNNTFSVVLSALTGGATGNLPTHYAMIIHLKKVDIY